MATVLADKQKSIGFIGLGVMGHSMPPLPPPPLETLMFLR